MMHSRTKNTELKIRRTLYAAVAFFVLSCLFLVPRSAFPMAAASSVQLFLIPNATDVVAGQVTRSDLWLDTKGLTINAADVSIRFDPALMTITSAEHTDSIFNLWVREPQISSTDAIVRFTGGSTAPFYGKGVLGQIYWQPIKPGALSASLTTDSAVLLSDGQGTKASTEFLPANYTIVSSNGLPIINSTSHPDQNRWYQAQVVRLSWPTTPAAEYSYVVTHDENEVPDQTPDTPVGNVQLSPLGDGIYYFRLREHLPGKPWSATATRQFKIDATPPEPFVVHIARDERLFGGKPFASFVATDRMSGVVSYEVQEGNDPVEAITAPPYVFKGTGDKALRVTAVDRAGNRRIVTVLTSNIGLFVRLALALLVLILVLLWLVRRQRRR